MWGYLFINIYIIGKKACMYTVDSYFIGQFLHADRPTVFYRPICLVFYRADRAHFIISLVFYHRLTGPFYYMPIFLHADRVIL